MIATILLLFIVVTLGAASNIFMLAWGLSYISGSGNEKHSSDVKKRS